jgi:hypothetical protein
MTNKKLSERDIEDKFNISPKNKAIAALGRKMIDMSSQTTGTDDNSLMMANALSRLGETLESFGATFGPKSMAEVVKMTGMNQDIIKMLIAKAKSNTDASTNRAAEPEESLRPAHAKELRNKELNKGKGPAKSGKTTGPDDYDFLKYKNKKKDVSEAKDTHCSDKCCGSDVKAEDCKCPPTCKHCNCNAVSEGLADMADIAERDHEVQMARAELYKIAKYAMKLHDLLKGVSEAEGIEGWMQSKITKAADYMGSVYHTLDYDIATESKKTFKNTMTEADAVAYKKTLHQKLNNKK